MLHAMLTREVRCWGPFESLAIKKGMRVDGIDAEVLGLIADRARVLEVVFEACRVGRGKPVTREVLDASDVVSNTFMDRLVKLSASFGGDARRIIDALDSKQLQRWRSENTESLRAYFEEEGYLDPEEPLTKEEIHHRALEAAIRSRPDAELGEGWLDAVITGLLDGSPDVDRTVDP